jgi:hypothetical protein
MRRILRLRDEQWERIREHFPEEQIPESSPGRKPGPARDVLEAALDSKHGRAMAHVAPVLPQLQDGLSAVSAVVRTGGAARHSDTAGKYVA